MGVADREIVSFLSLTDSNNIRYYANQIAGILSQGWPDSTDLCGWQEYMKGEKIKNDVRNGFDKGVGLAERRLNRLSHTD